MNGLRFVILCFTWLGLGFAVPVMTGIERPFFVGTELRICYLWKKDYPGEGRFFSISLERYWFVLKVPGLEDKLGKDPLTDRVPVCMALIRLSLEEIKYFLYGYNWVGPAVKQLIFATEFFDDDVSYKIKIYLEDWSMTVKHRLPNTPQDTEVQDVLSSIRLFGMIQPDGYDAQLLAAIWNVRYAFPAGRFFPNPAYQADQYEMELCIWRLITKTKVTISLQEDPYDETQGYLMRIRSDRGYEPVHVDSRLANGSTGPNQDVKIDMSTADTTCLTIKAELSQFQVKMRSSAIEEVAFTYPRQAAGGRFLVFNHNYRYPVMAMRVRSLDQNDRLGNAWQLYTDPMNLHEAYKQTLIDKKWGPIGIGSPFLYSAGE